MAHPARNVGARVRVGLLVDDGGGDRDADEAHRGRLSPAHLRTDGELMWHTDMSSYEAPPNQTILHAIEVPAEKGHTGFDNMYLAYDALPARLRERVEGLTLKHDATIDAAAPLG